MSVGGFQTNPRGVEADRSEAVIEQDEFQTNPCDGGQIDILLRLKTQDSRALGVSGLQP